MNSLPNAPSVFIRFEFIFRVFFIDFQMKIISREKTIDSVIIQWNSSLIKKQSKDNLTIIGYKIFVNNRLIAIVNHDQTSYRLINGKPCDQYRIHVQSITLNQDSTNLISKELNFIWPGIRPGLFQRLNCQNTQTIVLSWETPQLEDSNDEIISYKVSFFFFFSLLLIIFIFFFFLFKM